MFDCVKEYFVPRNRVGLLVGALSITVMLLCVGIKTSHKIDGHEEVIVF